jgi:autoinducer 2-degrading protein
MLVLAVHVTIKAGSEDEAIAHMLPLEAASRKEPGCLAYVVQRSRENPRHFLIYEQYKDDAALDEHRASAHFEKHARNGFFPLVEEREAELYNPIS